VNKVAARTTEERELLDRAIELSSAKRACACLSSNERPIVTGKRSMPWCVLGGGIACSRPR